MILHMHTLLLYMNVCVCVCIYRGRGAGMWLWESCLSLHLINLDFSLFVWQSESVCHLVLSQSVHHPKFAEDSNGGNAWGLTDTWKPATFWAGIGCLSTQGPLRLKTHNISDIVWNQSQDYTPLQVSATDLISSIDTETQVKAFEPDVM